jgi:pyruvate/2-oxoglutarate dehydrogenase complex dihydrolipoamide dehydrogenase (E3) component
MTTQHDVIILGARRASAGKKTLLIEREHLGGTCVNDIQAPSDFNL